MMFDRELNANLSVEAQEIFEELLEDQPTPIEDMLEEALAYQEQLHEHLASGEFPDEELAEELAARCVELLERVIQADEPSQRLAQAAARYIIEPLDEDDDFGSPAGLDDDREIFNAVAARLGFEDLLIGY